MESRRDDNQIAAEEDPAKPDLEATAPAVAPRRDETRERKDHIGKRLFASARLIEDMLRGFLPPALVGEVDYGTLKQHRTEILAANGVRRIPDVLWAADRPDGGRLLVLIELQTKNAANMAARMAAQTALLYENMPKDLRAPDGRHPSVLPVVVHCGDGKWTATEDMAAWADADDPLVAAFVAGRCYATLDAMALGRDDLPERNRMSVFARIRARESGLEMALEVQRSFAWIGEDEPELRTALRDWMYTNAEDLGVTPEDRRDMENLDPEKEVEMLVNAMRRWGEKMEEQGHKQGREEGIEVGLVQGMDHERGLLRRQAERRFGPETGDRLASLLVGVADPSRLERVGYLIVDCDDGEELIDRLNGRPRT